MQTSPTLNWQKSLKPKPIEEFLDYYFYRRVAGLIVPVFIRLRVSPNQITTLSLIFGLIASWMVFHQNFIWSGVFALWAIFFDCCDGQVARLTNQKSPLGRAMDGLFDTIWVTTLWLGIYFSGYFQSQGVSILPLMVVASLSMIVHCFRFDAAKIKYLELADPANLEGDLDFSEAMDFLRDRTRRFHFFEAIIALVMVAQMYLFVRGSEKKQVYSLSATQREEIRNLLSPEINRWSYLGEGHHNTLVILGVLLAPMGYWGLVVAFVMIAVPMNLWWLICEWRTRNRLNAVRESLK